MNQYGLEIVSAATSEPVSLYEAKIHLRVEHNDDNGYIVGLIKAATARAENYTRRAFVTQTLRLTLDAFPAGRQPVHVPVGPVQSVTEIAYTDSNGDAATFADFVLDATKTRARIYPVYGESWPGALSIEDAVRVTFVAGYGAQADVPESIKLAIKLMVGTWYDGPRSDLIYGDTATMLPETSKHLLGPYRAGGGVY